MANETEIFKRNLRRFLGRDATSGEVGDFERSGQSARSAIEGLFSSQGFREIQQAKAEKQFNPVLQGLQNEEADSALFAQTRQRELPEEVLGQFSRRGLLRSGGASRSLTEGLTGLSRQRALEKADIASRRSQAFSRRDELVNSLINDPRNQFFQEQEAEAQRQLREQELELQRQQLELQRASLRRGSGGGSGSGSSALNSLITALTSGGQPGDQTNNQNRQYPMSLEEQKRRQDAADALVRLRTNQNAPRRSLTDRVLRETLPQTLDEKSGAGFLTNLGLALTGPIGAAYQTGRSIGKAKNAFQRLFGN